MAIQQKNIFNHLNNITFDKDVNYYKNLNESERKDFGVFMIQRFISMEKKYISLISFIDKYAFNCLDKEQYHFLLLKLLPKQKMFFNYIKKDKSEKEDKLIIELIANKFQIGKKEAEQYLQYYDKEDIVELMRSFGTEEKLVKKYK